MIPNDYDLWLERQAKERVAATAGPDLLKRLRDSLTTPEPRPTPTVADVQIASAVGFIESAQAEVAKARRAIVAADLDPTGLDSITRDLGRELTWLNG